MNRITTLLVGVGTLALGACSGPEEPSNDSAGTMLRESASITSMPTDAAQTSPAVASDQTSETATEAARQATVAKPTTKAPAAPKKQPTAKATPKEQPKTSAGSEKNAASPTPAPNSTCSPEHRALGHC
jgi:hypothetical protein